MFFPTWTPNIKGKNSISVLEQVKINGTKHEIMIRGKDLDNPILLFVHGGPGCPEIPYVGKYQDLLEQSFTVVQYDQRASGKSYHFFEDYSDLSTDLLVEDLLAMTDYIANRLGQEKVILAGHSFGTYIAVSAAYQAPEKYEAYIGIGQMSDTISSEMDSLYYCIDQAELQGNTKDVAYLRGLTGKIQVGGMLTPREYVRKYGGAARLIDDNKDYAEGFLLRREYNLLDVVRYYLGVTYSQDILLDEVIQNPLPDKIKSLEIPCYFVMGQYDYMTSVKSAKKYFDSLQAEVKEFNIYEQSAHYPQFEEKDKFYHWMCDTFIH